MSWIGNDFEAGDAAYFDTEVMRRLYAYGRDRARADGFWRDRPPNAEEQVRSDAAASPQ